MFRCVVTIYTVYKRANAELDDSSKSSKQRDKSSASQVYAQLDTYISEYNL